MEKSYVGFYVFKN